MDTGAQLATTLLTNSGDIAKKALEVLGEIMKILLQNASQANRPALENSNLAKIVNAKDSVQSSPISKKDIKPFMNLSREYQTPVAILKSGEGYMAVFKKSDAPKVASMMQEMHKSGKFKDVVLTDRQAKLFKKRAKAMGVSAYIYDTKKGNKKVVFRDTDEKNVKSILKDISKERHLQTESTRGVMQRAKAAIKKTNDHVKNSMKQLGRQDRNKTKQNTER